MRVLFLGPPCPAIEDDLKSAGHEIARLETKIDETWLAAGGFDFGISYRYKKLISPSVIDCFRGRLINLHISYLPWNRGADPNLWSFLENTPAGVSIHKVDQGLDTGPLFLCQKVTLDIENDTLATSWLKLSNAVEKLFVDHRPALLAGQPPPIDQRGPGSYHRSADKKRFQHLLANGWDTPVKNLINQARQPDKE